MGSYADLGILGRDGADLQHAESYLHDCVAEPATFPARRPQGKNRREQDTECSSRGKDETEVRAHTREQGRKFRNRWT